MPVDYSKWDALELSDDSDIEVHPNVDKRSFIRAKQSQIHQERQHRKHEIDTLKYERLVNDGLLSRIDKLLEALQSHMSSAPVSDEAADGIVLGSLLESAGDLKDDKPPPKPEGVHTQEKEEISYSKMMAALIDQVKKSVDEQKPSHRLDGFAKEIGVHKAKVQDLQVQLNGRLAELEKLEGSKITSESIRDGFNSSHVAKASGFPSTAKSSTRSQASSVELLNSPGTGADVGAPRDSGSEADVEDTGIDATQHIQPTILGKAFAKLPQEDYRAYLDFISKNPSVLAEKETDGLLMQAFDRESEGKEKEARFCVHQALLLQYCRSLGRDGVALFFKRITTHGHQARKVFFDDVNSTYARLRERSKAIAQEGGFGDDDDGAGGVEQIQLHAVNPGQKIHIAVPSAEDPEEAEARRLFDAFPPGLQRALESGELDEVNRVLGKMSVDEAEQVVEQLSAGGMLSMEEGVIDATTEEGRKQVEEIERGGRREAGGGGGPEQMAEVEEHSSRPEKLTVDEVD